MGTCQNGFVLRKESDKVVSGLCMAKEQNSSGLTGKFGVMIENESPDSNSH